LIGKIFINLNTIREKCWCYCTSKIILNNELPIAVWYIANCNLGWNASINDPNIYNSETIDTLFISKTFRNIRKADTLNHFSYHINSSSYLNDWSSWDRIFTYAWSNWCTSRTWPALLNITCTRTTISIC
jgi:hypothetical protein